MRILHVIHSLDPRSGGPSASLRLLAGAQQAAGHDVSIVTTDVQSAEPWTSPDAYRRQLREDPDLSAISLEVLPGLGRRKPFSRFRYTPKARRTFERLFERKSHPEIVHIHGLFSHLTMTAARVARRWNIPYVMRPAGGLNPLCYRSGAAPAKRLLFRWAERRNLEAAAFVHATSAREKRELLRLLPGQCVHVIPHGCSSFPSVDRQYARSVFFRKFPEFEGKRTILYMSRIAPKKRLDLLVEAFAEMAAKSPDLMLAVAGSDAGSRAKVERRVAQLGLPKRIRFLGFLTGLLKEGAMSSACCLALPSRDENFGLVIVEAMAHGLPVVVSEGVDSHVYVRRAKAGIVVKSSTRSLRRGLETLLQRDLESHGENGKCYVERHLTWPRIASLLEEHYREASCAES